MRMRDLLRRRVTCTQHTVCCPVYDCHATITAYTHPRAIFRRRYYDLAACSLLPQEPVVPYAPPSFVAENLYIPPCVSPQQLTGHPPRHATTVPCRKTCLALLNAAVPAGQMMQRHHTISGTMDGVDLAREVAHATETGVSISQTLWSYMG